MKSAIPLAVIGLGFVLLLTSAAWNTLFPPTQTWTAEKGQRMSEVKAKINDVGARLYKAQGRTYGGPDPGPIKAEFDALTREFDQLKIEFETATERPKTVSNYLKWTGIFLSAVGVIGWYATKQA